MKLRHVVLPWRARPRLLGAIAVGAAVTALLPDHWVHHAGSRFLVGWNVGALLYLLLAGAMMVRSGHEQMRRRALVQDEGRQVVLTCVVLAAVIVLVAVGSQLVAVKAMPGPQRYGHIAMAALTVVTSWFFTQTMFALHYAHDFYMVRHRQQPDPLLFPGTADPLYRDFVYFACVIGTSGQTADVPFNGAALRAIGAVHCVLAFFFNTTVLALTINIAAGLF
jgi:uncharacterized membrane protein